MFRARMNSQVIGVRLAIAASTCSCMKPGTISGGGAKTSGKVFDSSTSARMFQRERPPVSGAGTPKTTRPIRVSRNSVATQRARFGVRIDRAVFEAHLVETT